MDSNLRTQIAEKIMEKRPNLGEKSLKSYVSTLFNLPKKMDEISDDVDWFDDNIDEIMDYLKDVEANRRKSILSPLYVLTGDESIHQLMISDAKVVNEKYKTQTKSESEKENWISWDKIVEKFNTRSIKANKLFKQKVLSKDDINFLNEYVILSCYVLFPPRRLMDYGMMKIRGCDQSKDNCMTAKKMTFNVYKTAKVYGKQEFDMPTELTSIFRKWSKINPSSYLIWNEKGKPTNSQQLNAILNRIFDGMDVSVNILRHSYLTHYYSGKMPTLLEMEDTALKMGHSVKQAMLYIKRA